MPYICLANESAPRGVIQITDLWPNESQRIPGIDPPGQNRYLNRVHTEDCEVNSTTGVVQGIGPTANYPQFLGLAAYMLDRVEPGALEQAAGEILLTNPQAGDQVTIKGVVFEFQAGANDLVGKAGTGVDPFLIGIGILLTDPATNLAAALNDAGDVIPAMVAQAPANVHVVAAAPGPQVGRVTLVAVTDPGAVVLLGSDGDLPISTAAPLDITVPTTGRMGRTNERWSDSNMTNLIDALLTRMDSGLSMTLANINTVLLAEAGAELTNAGGSASTGTVADVLSILAGRDYAVPVGALKYTAAVAPDTVRLWSATQRGRFTTPNLVFDTTMTHGEWRPTTGWTKRGKERQSVVTGGDTVNLEIRGVRITVDSTHFQHSLHHGQLAAYTAGITMFPDADVRRFISNWTRRTHRQDTLLNQRVITVYDDDGTLLA